jgi:hypothetical protein
MGLFILPKLEEMEEIPIFRSKIKLYISSYLYNYANPSARNAIVNRLLRFAPYLDEKAFFWMKMKI